MNASPPKMKIDVAPSVDESKYSQFASPLDADAMDAAADGGRRHSFYAYTRSKVNRKFSKFKKTQFFCILAVCLGILFFQTAQCFKKYFRYSTGTADKYVHVSRTSFPELTICPTYPYRLDRLNHHGLQQRGGIQFDAKWTSTQEGVTPQDFYKDVTLKLEDIVHQVDIYAEVVINGQNLFKLRPNETFCGEALFNVKQYYYNGDCFALVMPSCLSVSGVLEIVLDFTNKTDIFIHHPGQFLSPNSRSRVDVERGHFVKIAVNHEVVQLLSEEGNCTDYDPDSDIPTEVDFDGCMYARLKEIEMDEVGCTVPWLPDKEHICVEEEDRVRAFQSYQRNRRNQEDICPNSCLFTNMYFGPPVTGLQNAEYSDVARAIFYFRRDVKTTTEYFLYSLLSMVAEIGGYVGLLMGVSLFKVAEINNHAIDYYGEREAEKELEEEMRRRVAAGHYAREDLARAEKDRNAAGTFSFHI